MEKITRPVSFTERQLRRLVVPEPKAYDRRLRIDIIHRRNQGLSWGGLPMS